MFFGFGFSFLWKIVGNENELLAMGVLLFMLSGPHIP